MSTAPSPIDRLRAMGVAAAVGIGGIAVGIILALVATIVLFLGGIDPEARPLPHLVASLILIQGVAFGSVALAYLRYRGVGLAYLRVRVPTARDLLWVLGGWVLAFVAVFVGATLITSTGAEPADNRVAEIAIGNPGVLLLLIPASFLLIGPGEELLFRGVVQGRLRESFGPIVGVVLASAIFAAIHFTALTGGVGGRLATIGVLFFPSLVFGAAYEHTGNLAVPALIHGGYNATLFGLLYVALRAMENGLPA